MYIQESENQEFRNEGQEMTEEMQRLEWVEFNEELKRYFYFFYIFLSLLAIIVLVAFCLFFSLIWLILVNFSFLTLILFCFFFFHFLLFCFYCYWLLSLFYYFLIVCPMNSEIGTRCPNKHGNSVKNLISSLLWPSIVIPNFKSNNIFMSARMYLMKTVNGFINGFIKL